VINPLQRDFEIDASPPAAGGLPEAIGDRASSGLSTACENSVSCPHTVHLPNLPDSETIGCLGYPRAIRERPSSALSTALENSASHCPFPLRFRNCGCSTTSWILDSGFWILDSGIWILDSGNVFFNCVSGNVFSKCVSGF